MAGNASQPYSSPMAGPKYSHQFPGLSTRRLAGCPNKQTIKQNLTGRIHCMDLRGVAGGHEAASGVATNGSRRD